MFSTFRNMTMGAAALALATAFVLPAQATYIITLEQVGSNVVANGHGSLDITDLSFRDVVDAPFINPGLGDLYVGSGSANLDGPISVSGPSNFGSGGFNNSASGSGNVAGIANGLGGVVVPEGYVSGDALSGSATWDNATFTSLGVTPGTYKWTWGTGAHADSLTLDIKTAAAVPEPASLALFGVALAGLGVALRRRA
jgi:hypothetical protein